MAKKTNTTEKVAEVKAAPTFTKKQFIKSQRFAKQRDLLNVLLEEDKTYTIEGVEKIITNFFNPKKTK